MPAATGVRRRRPGQCPTAGSGVPALPFPPRLSLTHYPQLPIAVALWRMPEDYRRGCQILATLSRRLAVAVARGLSP